MAWTRRRLWTMVATALATLFLVLFSFNFIRSEKLATISAQRKTEPARRALGLFRLWRVAVAAPEVIRVVIVVAQPEEPHQPHDQRADVEDAEPDHEDPPLQCHLNRGG